MSGSNQPGDPAPDTSDLERMADQVVSIMVDTFGFDRADAEHRINLWKADQHRLEGEALDAILPMMDPERAKVEMLRYFLEGHELAERLEEGQKRLGL